jgi:hypothetical protein
MRTPTAPDEESIQYGTKLICQIDRALSGHGGEVKDQAGATFWPYKSCDARPPWTIKNPLRKPDFIVVEQGTEKKVSIRRASFVSSRFHIVEAEKVIGAISVAGTFRNQYSIAIDGIDSWIFYMPLFTIRFYGNSALGTEIWVVVGPSQREWNILLKPDVVKWPLVAALAFIHHERYFYS